MSALSKQSKQYLAHRIDEVRRKLEASYQSLRHCEDILNEVTDTIDPTYRHPIDFVRHYNDAIYEARRWIRQ